MGFRMASHRALGGYGVQQGLYGLIGAYRASQGL